MNDTTLIKEIIGEYRKLGAAFNELAPSIGRDNAEMEVEHALTEKCASYAEVGETDWHRKENLKTAIMSLLVYTKIEDYRK